MTSVKSNSDPKTKSSSVVSGGCPAQQTKTDDKANTSASGSNPVWNVLLNDGSHTVEFEHGTTTGKRIIKVDGKEILRRDWVFKLVGSEQFEMPGGSGAKCVVKIEPDTPFTYSYALEVNGKSYNKFRENQSKILQTWIVDDLPNVKQPYRVVLEKDSLDVYVNGQKMETMAEFVEDGTERHFTIGGSGGEEGEKGGGVASEEVAHPASIRSFSTGDRRHGLVHCLIVNQKPVPPQDNNI